MSQWFQLPSLILFLQLLKRRIAAIRRHNLSSRAHNAIELLGIDGMSSEESEGEIGSKSRRFRVKLLPWRHRIASEWLHCLDRLPMITTLSAKQPSGRRMRRDRQMGSTISHERKAPIALPEWLYDPEWLQRVTTEDVSESAELMQLLREAQALCPSR
jgi:hypothetical protein